MYSAKSLHSNTVMETYVFYKKCCQRVTINMQTTNIYNYSIIYKVGVVLSTSCPTLCSPSRNTMYYVFMHNKSNPLKHWAREAESWQENWAGDEGDRPAGDLMRWIFFSTSLMSASFLSSLPFFNLKHDHEPCQLRCSIS